MLEYRIEKHRAPVTLRLRDGSEVKGRVFLATEPADEPWVGKIQKLLNGSEPFLPIEVEGAPVVHNKDRVLWCRYDGPLGPVVEILLPRRRVTLVLDGGSSLTGDLVADGPPERRRVLDCLNQAPAFLLVEALDGDYLVRRESIVVVPSAEQGDPRRADAFEVEEQGELVVAGG